MHYITKSFTLSCIAIITLQADLPKPLEFYRHSWDEEFSNVWVVAGMKSKTTRTKYLQQIVAQAAASKDKKPTLKDLTGKADGTGTQSALVSPTKLAELLKTEQDKLKAMPRATLLKNDQERIDKYPKKHFLGWTPRIPSNFEEILTTTSRSSYSSFRNQSNSLMYARAYIDAMFERVRSEQRKALIDKIHPQ